MLERLDEFLGIGLPAELTEHAHRLREAVRWQRTPPDDRGRAAGGGAAGSGAEGEGRGVCRSVGGGGGWGQV